jgi:hypothetical protein
MTTGRAESSSLPQNRWLFLGNDPTRNTFEFLGQRDLSEAARVCRYWRDFADPLLEAQHHEKAKALLGALQTEEESGRQFADETASPHSLKRRTVVAPEDAASPTTRKQSRAAFQSFIRDDARKIRDAAARQLGSSRVDAIVGGRDPRSLSVLQRLTREALREQELFVCASIALLSHFAPDDFLEISELDLKEKAEEIESLYQRIAEDWEVVVLSAERISSSGLAPYHQPEYLQNERMIQSIPSQLSIFADLRELNLSGNRVRMSESDVRTLLSLPNLQILDLSSNGIESLPPSFGDLPALQTLDLSVNRLNEIPLQGMDQLTELYLNDNRFSEIPLGLQLLPSLRLVTLYGNPFPFSELENLMRTLASLGKLGVVIIADGSVLQNLTGLHSLRDGIRRDFGMDLRVDLSSSGRYAHMASLSIEALPSS